VSDDIMLLLATDSLKGIDSYFSVAIPSKGWRIFSIASPGTGEAI
jgi:hypothetical protein